MFPALICAVRRSVPARAVALAVALVLAAHAGVAAAATQPYGGATPEDVVERMRAAAETEDLGEMAACLSPDDRAALSMTMLMMTGMVMAFASMGAAMGENMADTMFMGIDDDESLSEEERAEARAAAEAEAAEAMVELEAMTAGFEAILKKHDLEDVMEDDTSMEDAEPAEMLAGVDQIALLQDLMGFLESLPGESEEGEGEGADAPVDVPEGELTGLVVDGDSAHGTIGDEEVDFVKVDGRWYLSLDLLEQMQGGGEMEMEEMDEEMMEEEMEEQMEEDMEEDVEEDGGGAIDGGGR